MRAIVIFTLVDTDPPEVCAVMLCRDVDCVRARGETFLEV